MSRETILRYGAHYDRDDTEAVEAMMHERIPMPPGEYVIRRTIHISTRTTDADREEGRDDY